MLSDSLVHTQVLSSPTLYSLQVPIVDNTECLERMGEYLTASIDFVLCAGEEGNSVDQVWICMYTLDTYMYTYICIPTCRHVCMSAYLHADMQTFVYLHLYTNELICVYTYMYT